MCASLSSPYTVISSFYGGFCNVKVENLTEFRQFYNPFWNEMDQLIFYYYTRILNAIYLFLNKNMQNKQTNRKNIYVNGTFCVRMNFKCALKC